MFLNILRKIAEVVCTMKYMFDSKKKASRIPMRTANRGAESPKGTVVGK
jgi:hypothetical protein